MERHLERPVTLGAPEADDAPHEVDVVALEQPDRAVAGSRGHQHGHDRPVAQVDGRPTGAAPLERPEIVEGRAVSEVPR